MTEKRTKRTPAERVQALLEKQKYRTEAEVMERVKGATRPMIRAVRRHLGIDRPSCLADVRKALEDHPEWKGAAAISYARSRYGIQLGAPDVSRLRPKKIITPKLKKDIRSAYYAAQAAGLLGAATNAVRGKRDKASREIRAAVAIIKKDISKGAKKP